MAVLMLITACYGVLQLALLSAWTRTVRASVLMLAVAVGVYGAGVGTVLLELLYTRAMASMTDTGLIEVVRTAGYTVDPFIEEVTKVAPLLLIALLHRRMRAQLGLADFVLIGAAIGAGFGLTESLLRFSSDAASASGGLFEGWSWMRGSVQLHVRGLGDVVTAWIPAPVLHSGAVSAAAPTSLHLAWSALAGLGVGLLLRFGRVSKLVGVMLLCFCWLDHASYNQRLMPDSDGFVALFAGPMSFFNGHAWLYPLAALAVATYIDLPAVRAGKAALSDVLTAAEQSGQPAIVGLGGFATKGLPWTPLVAWRFVLVRRSLMYARAVGADISGLHQTVREVRNDIEATNNTAAWRGVKILHTNRSRAVRPRVVLWPLVLWMVLLIPAVLYFVFGTIPLTSGIQAVMTSSFVRPIFVILTIAGLAWLGWQLVHTTRALPALLRAEVAAPAASTEFRIMIAGGALALGLLNAVRWLGGADARSPAVSNVHILDALGHGMFLTSIVLPILALSMFPPSSLALAGGGTMLAASTARTWLGMSATMHMLGILLMQAAGGGGGPGGSGPSGGGPGTAAPPKPDLPQKTPAVRPSTSNPKLNNLLENLYKGTNNPNRVGEGTTMDAVRNEILTGRPTAGRWHIQKAEETITGLQNWLKRNPNAPAADQDIARNLIQELRNALRGI